MGKVTFVVDFEDGEEPMVSAATEILGGGDFLPFCGVTIAMIFSQKSR